MSAKVNLWKMEGVVGFDTGMARCYSRVPPERHPEQNDLIWIPISIIEHTSQNMGGHHVLTLPDWFVEKERL